jgi:hypothetical protein
MDHIEFSDVEALSKPVSLFIISVSEFSKFLFFLWKCDLFIYIFNHVADVWIKLLAEIRWKEAGFDGQYYEHNLKSERFISW